VSSFGEIIDRLEVLVRAAVPDMPAGDLGWTRGLTVGQELSDSRLPHCLAYEPSREVSEIDHRQEVIEISVVLGLWTRNETQEELATRLDAVRSQILGDPTLNGLVDRAWISADGIREFEGKAERAGILVVQTEEIL
jgi:hypothetical protein